MAFKSASSPGSYNQLIAHDDKTSKLRAAQDKDRNDQIAHNKQLADTHRNHAKSFDFAVEVEASARRNAIQFDEYVRGVNQKFELASIQAANATAMRNSQNEQIEQANNQAQIMGLVQKTIGTVSTVIDATNKAKERAELEAAQGFKQKWSLTAEGHFGLGKITEAMWADDAKLEASQLAAKQAGMTWADIQQYQSLGSAAKTAINQNYLHGQLQQAHTLAIADDQLISNGKTFKEWADSGLPESTSQVEFLTRRKVSQIFEMASSGGYDVNPAAFDALIEKTVASAVNGTRRNIETQAAAKVADENRHKNINVVENLGYDGYFETLNGLDKDKKRSVATRFLNTELELTQAGIRDQTDVELLGDAPVGTSGFTVRNHPSYAGIYRDIVKANNSYRSTLRNAAGLKNFEDTQQARDWVKNEVPNMNAEELQAVKQNLEARGIKDSQIDYMLNAAADKLPKNAVQVELQEYVKVNKAWASIAELRRIGGDAAIPYINEVEAMRNKDQWWLAQKNKMGAMAAGALGFSGEKARDQASYHTVVPMLRAQGADLMQKYRSEGMTELQAQGQVEAWLEGLDDKVKTDPFGDHILGVWDKAKNPKGEGFKIHDKVDKIVPLRNVKSSDISKAIAPHIKGDVYTNRKGVQEYLRTNSSALNGIVSTDDAIRMLDAIHTNENASRLIMNIFADVGSYTGTGYSQAAIDFLKGKGIDYKPPKNQAYEEISNKMDAAIFETIVQRHGPTSANMIANDQTQYRGNNTPMKFGSAQGWGLDPQSPGIDVYPVTGDYVVAPFPNGVVVDKGYDYKPNGIGGDGRRGVGWGNWLKVRHTDPTTNKQVDVLYAHFPNGQLDRYQPGSRIPQYHRIGLLATAQQFDNRSDGVGSGNGVHQSMDFYTAGTWSGYNNISGLVNYIKGLGGNQQQPQTTSKSSNKEVTVQDLLRFYQEALDRGDDRAATYWDKQASLKAKENR